MTNRLKKNNIMFIDYFVKTEDGGVRKTKSDLIPITRKGFIQYYKFFQNENKNLTIKDVNAKPKEFQFNVLYIQKETCSKKSYIYVNLIDETP